MKSYLINLKKDTLKLQQAMHRLRSVNIEPIRVDAVYGKEKSKEEIELHSTDKIFSRIYDDNFRYMNVGAWGCSYSHLKACQLIASDSDDSAIIFEDDIFWLDNSKRVKNVLLKLEELNFDFIPLGYSPRGKINITDAELSGECIEITSKYKLIPYKYFSGGTGGGYAYAVSKKMAKKMWPENEIVDRDADGFLELYERLPEYREGMYVLFPPLVHSSLGVTNIWADKSGLKNKVLSIINNNSFLLRVFSKFQQKRLTKNYLKFSKEYKRNF